MTEIVGDLHDEVKCKDKQFNQRMKWVTWNIIMITPCHFQFDHETSTLGMIVINSNADGVVKCNY